MSYRHWHVGMKVVCVDATPVSPASAKLQRNNVYTISAIQAGLFLDRPDGDTWLEGVGIKLVEVPTDHHQWFHPQRFRPVQERKTDISIFTSMLTKPKVPA
jgi:hypothetical protein